MRLIANQNEVQTLPPAAVDVPVYVTKDDAREAQRAESLFYGGVIPSGGMASQMQVSGSDCVMMIVLTRSAECGRQGRTSAAGEYREYREYLDRVQWTKCRPQRYTVYSTIHRVCIRFGNAPVNEVDVVIGRVT